MTDPRFPVGARRICRGPPTSNLMELEVVVGLWKSSPMKGDGWGWRVKEQPNEGESGGGPGKELPSEGGDGDGYMESGPMKVEVVVVGL